MSDRKNDGGKGMKDWGEKTRRREETRKTIFLSQENGLMVPGMLLIFMRPSVPPLRRLGSSLLANVVAMVVLGIILRSAPHSFFLTHTLVSLTITYLARD